MPDKRSHRGPHPQDAADFASKAVPALCRAVADFSLLLTKGYASKSSLKLVGDRFSLTARQRMAVMRTACSDTQLTNRTSRQLPVENLLAKPIVIDGYNLLITIEAALSGAPIFIARDGSLRDLAGLHGSYRKVEETIPALRLIADCLEDIGTTDVRWLFDSPVSNSGRLKTMISRLAAESAWPWRVELLQNPDTELIATDIVIATSDSDILDKCTRWTNLTAQIIKNHIPSAWIIDLSTQTTTSS